MINLRPAVPSDISTAMTARTIICGNLQKEAEMDELSEWFKDCLKDGNRTLLIASDEGRPIGVVLMTIHAPSYCELAIDLMPKERGKGYTLKVLKKIVDDQGGTRLVLKCLWSDTILIKSAKEAGFKIDDDKLELIILDASGNELNIKE